MGKIKNEIGNIYRYLTVIDRAGNTSDGTKKWLCSCKCGKIKVIRGTSLRDGSISSCGCYAIEQRRRGKDHHNWNGGITPEIKKLRLSTEYKKWRNKVIKRDIHACQKCHKNNMKFQVHHILNFASNPDLRLDIDNGITLCIECHKHFHSKYSRRHNTQAQLDNFLKES